MATGINTYIWKNNIKSWVLLFLFPLFFFITIPLLYVAYSFSSFYTTKIIDKNYGSHQQQVVVVQPDQPTPSLPLVVDLASHALMKTWHWVILGVLSWFVAAYFIHDKLIRAATRAVALSRSEMPKLYNLLENLCISRGMVTPKLFVMEIPSLNAFASGINDNTYAITVTRGLINGLNDDEIESVLAHDLVHIQNDDARLLTISIIFVGIISFCLGLVTTTIITVGSFSGVAEELGGGAVVGVQFVFFGVFAFVVFYLSEFFSVLIRMSYSQESQFLADAGAVMLTKKPEALISALVKIAKAPNLPKIPHQMYDLFIVAPSPHVIGSGSHPTIKSRLEALLAISNNKGENLSTYGYTADLDKEPVMTKSQRQEIAKENMRGTELFFGCILVLVMMAIPLYIYHLAPSGHLWETLERSNRALEKVFVIPMLLDAFVFYLFIVTGFFFIKNLFKYGPSFYSKKKINERRRIMKILKNLPESDDDARRMQLTKNIDESNIDDNLKKKMKDAFEGKPIDTEVILKISQVYTDAMNENSKDKN